MALSPCELRSALVRWNRRSGREAKRSHRHRVGAVATMNVLPVTIRTDDRGLVSFTIALVDVPACGNCLYHAVWSSAERQGISLPFGLRGISHVYTLRVRVAEQVVRLMERGVLREEQGPLEVGDLVATPDQYLKYSGQVPLMAMAKMLKRTIVTLSSDGISAVSPHDFEELVGEPERHRPIFIYHCSADSVQSTVPFSRRNHYCAVTFDDHVAAVLQQLVVEARSNAETMQIDLTLVPPHSVQDQDVALVMQQDIVDGSINTGAAVVDLTQVSPHPVQDQGVVSRDSSFTGVEGMPNKRRKKGARRAYGCARVQPSCANITTETAAQEKRIESSNSEEPSDHQYPAESLKDLSDCATTVRHITEEQLRALAASQQYTRCPRLALLFFHCCSNDPRAYVFNNERLNDDNHPEPLQRLEAVLEGPVTAESISRAQQEAGLRSSANTTLTACASCCEILSERESEECLSVSDLSERFELTDEELTSLLLLPEAIRSAHVQVYEANGKFYHLNPDLVVDEHAVELCKKCRVDPRKYKYSIASGHDYGRIATLPKLNDISSCCIAPLRCFGIELSLSGKHSTGHSICFPSDGPVKCAKVLPLLDINDAARVTFIGPRDEWRLKKQKFAGLYDLAVDDVYAWLEVLTRTHSGFREHNIVVVDSRERREELERAREAIEANVAFEESRGSNRSNRDETASENDEESQRVLVTSSAVLKPVSDEVGRGGSTRIIDSLLEVVEEAREGPPNDTVIPVRREDDPIVEWTNNGKMIACAFPQLFLLGGHFLPTGTWSKDIVCHLMAYYDGRFERDSKFVALLFNQLQRHAATRRAAKVGISSTASLERFGTLVSSDRFRERLVEAKNNPASASTKRLNAALLRILSLVGSCVPFSPFERASSRPKIAALRYRYGVPQHFVTIAPPEQDDLILQRIAMLRRLGTWNRLDSPFCSKDCTFADFPEDLRISPRARLAVANEYPALAAQVFQRRMMVVFEDVIACSHRNSVKLNRHFRERQHGPFGKVAAHCYVVEPQRDGRLHAHALLYNSAYTPELLTRISCSTHLRDRAAAWLESVSSTRLQERIHEWRSKMIEEGSQLPRAFELRFPSAAQDLNAFFYECEKLMAATNIHSHSSTCFKSKRGKHMCRLARPAGVNNGQTAPLLITREATGNLLKGTRAVVSGHALDERICQVLDAGYDYGTGELFRRPFPGPIVWELHRPESDKFVVESNRTLAGLTCSHTNSSIINGEDAGDVVEQYQQNYMTKDEPSLKEGIPVLLAAIDHMKAYPSRADDRDTDIRRGKYAATRTVNAFTGAHEWSHSVMVHAISGHRSFTSSDSFWYLFPHTFVLRLVSKDGATSGLCETPAVLDNDVVEPENAGAEIDVELAELVAMATNDSHHQDSSSVAGRVGGTRSYRIDDRTVFVSQVESYIHRGEHFKDYSPVEFECIVDVLRIRDDPEHHAGRKRRRGFPFAESHPLHGHYMGYLRAKQHTPIFGGAPPPTWKQKSKRDREATSRYVLAAFTSWSDEETEFPLNERGLRELCQNWDHSDTPLISRQRYRYIRNVLKRGHRNSRNEQIASDWRNRNVDLWKDLNPVEHGQGQRERRRTHQDPEKDGYCDASIDLFTLTQSVMMGNSKKRDQLRAIRLRFESVMQAETSSAEARSLSRFDRNEPLEHGFFTGHHENQVPLRAIAARLSTLTQPHTIDDTERSVLPGHGSVSDNVEIEDYAPDVPALSTEQRRVYQAVLDGLSSSCKAGKQTRTLLHGPGGTGKSFLVRTITREVERRGFEVVNTCTTGAGACQLTKGYTFHSALKVRPPHLTDDAREHLKQLFTPNVKLVVVDEVSMLSPDLLCTLDERLKRVYNPNVDFGGLSILLVGDFFQLPVVRGTSLCALMYLGDPNAARSRAQVLFQTFKVLFLTDQQRAIECQQQQHLLRAFRALPPTYPVGSEWTVLEQAAYRPITEEIYRQVIRPLTVADVAEDSQWSNNSVILVTGNADRAMLNACMASLIAKQTGRLVFRWRKTLSSTDDHILKIQDLFYNEEERPQLFGYFLKGAIGQVLDNSNGNVSMGVANGSRCRYHSFAWDDPDKTAIALRLIEAGIRTNETIVDLPFPPDFINIMLLDRNNQPLARSAWPSSDNLASQSDNDIVVVPIGIVKSTADKFKIKIPESVHHPELTIHFDQHAVDLAMALTVWKAQGSTFDRVILHLEGSLNSPAWQFEHIYVALSRVRAASHLRSLPLSVVFDRSKVLNLRPKVHTVKWLMDIGVKGYWDTSNHTNN